MIPQWFQNLSVVYLGGKVLCKFSALNERSHTSIFLLSTLFLQKGIQSVKVTYGVVLRNSPNKGSRPCLYRHPFITPLLGSKPTQVKHSSTGYMQ